MAAGAIAAAKQSRRGPRPSKSKERYWRAVMRRFAHSTGEVRAFCRAEGLSEPSFYSWRRELRRRDAVESNAGRVERSGLRRRAAAARASGNPEGRGLQTPGSPQAVFLPVRVAQGAGLTDGRPGAAIGARVSGLTGNDSGINDPRVEVLLRGGRILRVLGRLDRAAWGELLAALERTAVAVAEVPAFARRAPAVEPEGRC